MKNSKKNSNIKKNGQIQDSDKLRFAVIGLGYISQIAVLPAFAHASEKCKLSALVSGDEDKLEKLGKQYKVRDLFKYSQLDECLSSDIVDAVYIALPNSMHRDCTLQAARHRKHVLCEKPMALDARECWEMIEVCKRNQVKLMIAYRLHFERANLEVLSAIQSGKIGEPVIFNSCFSMQVAHDNIRTNFNLGGGCLYDLGIYCINAARNIFDAEPRRVSALISNPNEDARFTDVDGLTSCTLEFKAGQVANFVCSFSAFDAAYYEVIGTEGTIRVKNAYEFHEDISYEISSNKTGKRSSPKKIKKHDQFAPELVHFADCVFSDSEPQPNGHEGLADVRVINALFQSARLGRCVSLDTFEKTEAPSVELAKVEPPAIKKPSLVNAQVPSQ